MSFNIISRGVILNFIINLLIVFFLIHYEFELSHKSFTFLLVINLFLISLFTGISSKKNNHSSEINGLFVGLGSSLIIFLFLSQFLDLNWEINMLLATLWMFFGYLGGFIGSKMVKRKVTSN